MAETKTAASQVQQLPGMENVKKMFEEQTTRVNQMMDEVGKAHAKWIEYGNTQIDEMAELMKTQFNYFNDLASGWRKLTVDTMKKSMESFSS